jgi:hypothetical protein
MGATMSDVRLVTVDELNVPECLHQDYETIDDDPSGTHLLVPVKIMERRWLVGGGGGWGVALDEIVDCQTCGGNGWRQHAPQVNCYACNGRGWVVSDE